MKNEEAEQQFNKLAKNKSKMAVDDARGIEGSTGHLEKETHVRWSIHRC